MHQGLGLEPSDDIGQSINFSYTTYSYSHSLDETPKTSDLKAQGENIPVSAFSHHASAMQAIARYLVDVRGLSFAEAARVVGRKPKSLWNSYHQTTALPKLEESILIPLSIFLGTKPPLEALVLYLKSLNLRNVEIAELLKLDPKTTWTAAKRGEAKR